MPLKGSRGWLLPKHLCTTAKDEKRINQLRLRNIKMRESVISRDLIWIKVLNQSGQYTYCFD